MALLVGGKIGTVFDADTLAVEALAGILLAAVEQATDKPEAVARWSERGHAFFQAGGKKHSRKGTENIQNAASDA